MNDVLELATVVASCSVDENDYLKASLIRDNTGVSVLITIGAYDDLSATVYPAKPDLIRFANLLLQMAELIDE